MLATYLTNDRDEGTPTEPELPAGTGISNPGLSPETDAASPAGVSLAPAVIRELDATNTAARDNPELPIAAARPHHLHGVVTDEENTAPAR